MKAKAAVLAFAGPALTAVLAGCGNVDGANLLFGQQQSVGLNMSASTTDQGTSLHLGFKDQDIAIVPVAVPNPSPDAGNSMTVIHGESSSKDHDTGGRNLDALSVFGQFDLDAGGGTAGGGNVALGKFFATGVAATSLADGYKAKLGNETARHAGGDGGQ